jgi:hypothetical protein
MKAILLTAMLALLFATQAHALRLIEGGLST